MQIAFVSQYLAGWGGVEWGGRGWGEGEAEGQGGEKGRGGGGATTPNPRSKSKLTLRKETRDSRDCVEGLQQEPEGWWTQEFEERLSHRQRLRFGRALARIFCREMMP